MVANRVVVVVMVVCRTGCLRSRFQNGSSFSFVLIRFCFPFFCLASNLLRVNMGLNQLGLRIRLCVWLVCCTSAITPFSSLY